MSKAILITEMHEFCHKCNLTTCQHTEDDDSLSWYCLAAPDHNEELDISGHRPDWCPLLPFPPKQDSSNLYNDDQVHDSYIKGLDDGYNALREILERNNG